MAEIYALAEAGKEAVFLCEVFISLQYTVSETQTVVLHYDNQPVFHQISASGVSQKTKHYRTTFFLLHKYVKDGLVRLV